MASPDGEKSENLALGLLDGLSAGAAARFVVTPSHQYRAKAGGVVHVNDVVSLESAEIPGGHGGYAICLLYTSPSPRD